jgi:AcrR family transcriptional regulator
MFPIKDFGNKKLQQLIETAWNLFWRYGFTRVSIEEICQEAGVSKMTFYKHFKNKIDLVRFMMRELSESSLKLYADIMAEDIPFIEKVKKSVRLKFEQTENLSEAFFNDFHRQNDPELNRILIEQKVSNIKAVTDMYLEAQKEGDIRQDIKPEFIVYFMNHMMEMAKDDKLLALYDNPRDLVMELTNFFFYGLLPGDKR